MHTYMHTYIHTYILTDIHPEAAQICRLSSFAVIDVTESLFPFHKTSLSGKR